ncbi:MAG TPA: helix-turn-helix transcriptional regulator [Polyangiaceae bacterium]
MLRARQALGLSQVELARHLGSSERTGVRWAARQSQPSVAQYQRLAREIHPRDPELAALLASAGGVDLAALIPPPVAPSPPKPQVTVFHADAIVCAVADAMKLTPAAVRPGIAAAIARAAAMGTRLEDIAPFLDEPR